MMAFAMHSNMWKQMMMKMNCAEKKDCHSSCYKAVIKNKLISSNNNFSIKIIKIKLFSFIDIFSNSSYFLENKNLIRNTSPPPNLNKKIKYYSYSDLIKIIKSNI